MTLVAYRDIPKFMRGVYNLCNELCASDVISNCFLFHDKDPFLLDVYITCGTYWTTKKSLTGCHCTLPCQLNWNAAMKACCAEHGSLRILPANSTCKFGANSQQAPASLQPAAVPVQPVPIPLQATPVPVPGTPAGAAQFLQNVLIPAYTQICRVHTTLQECISTMYKVAAFSAALRHVAQKLFDWLFGFFF